MFVKRFIAVAAFGAALSAQPAAAAIVELKFQEFAGAQVNTQDIGPNVYHDWQNDFRAASNSGDYDFQFTYDTAAASPSHALTLVSGRQLHGLRRLEPHARLHARRGPVRAA